MNKMKRLFSFVLAFAIVLGAFVPFADVVLAEEAETTTEAETTVEKAEDKKDEEVKEEAKPIVPTFTDFLKAVPEDVKGTDAEAAVRRLVAFGVLEGYPDGSFKPANELTRAEFAKMAVLGLGLADAQEATTQNATRFPDVTASHWASGYINIASSQGIIIGFTDGTFRPNEKVTYAQAVTVITRALGYNDGILKGQWPENYLSKANEIKLTEAAPVPANYNTNIVRGDSAKLLDKALHTNVVEPVQYEGSTVVSRLLDKLLMTKTMGITQNKNARIVGDQYVDSNLKDLEANMLVKVKDEYTTKKISLERAAANYKRFVGEKATVYLDKDDIAVYVEGVADVNAKFDYVVDAKDLGRKGFDLELAGHDGKFELADEAVVYVMDNDKDVHSLYVGTEEVRRALKDSMLVDKVKVTDLKDRVGKVVVDGGKVVYAELTRNVDKLVAPKFLVVEEVTDTKIIGTTGNKVVEFSVDFSKDSKYDGIFVFDQDGVKKEVKDLKKGDVAYIQEQYFNRGDQLFVQVVQGSNVVGKVGRTKDASVELGDKTYDVLDYALVADGVYGDVADFKDNAQNLYGEEAVLYQGAGGLGVLLTNADDDFLSGYGVLLEVGYRGRSVTIAHEVDGKLVERTYSLSGRDSIADGYLNVLVKDANNDNDYVVKGNRNVSDIKASGKVETLAGQPVRFRLAGEDRVVENTLVFLDPSLRKVNSTTKFFKEAVVVGDFAGKVSDKVQVIEALGLNLDQVNRTGALTTQGEYFVSPTISRDFGLADYAKDLASSKKNNETLGVAVFPSRVGRVQAIVLYNEGIDALQDLNDMDESIFVKDLSKRGTRIDEVTYVSFESGEGKANDWTIYRDEVLEKNTVYVANVNRRGRLAVKENANAEGLEKLTATVASVDARKDTITTRAGETLVVLDGALVYNDKGAKVLVRDLEANQAIEFIRIEGTKFVTALVATGAKSTDKGVVEYITDIRLYVDGDRYRMDEDTLLFDENGKVIGYGGRDINGNGKDSEAKLEKGDRVKNIELRDGLVVSLTRLFTAEERVENAIDAIELPVELNDRAAIENARKVLEDAKDVIAPADYTKHDNAIKTLENALAELVAKNAVENVKALIEALPEQDKVTLNDKAAIEKARAEYKKLPLTEANKVDNLTKLEDAEDKIVALEEVAKAKANLTKLDVAEGADATEATIAKPKDSTTVTYAMELGKLPTFAGNGDVTGTDPVSITKDANEFKFEITVTIEDKDQLAKDTVVFVVTVPNTSELPTVAVK